MRWRRGGRSRNLEDRRGLRGSERPGIRRPALRRRGAPPPSGGRLRVGVGGLVVLVVLSLVLRTDLVGLFGVATPGTGPDVSGPPAAAGPAPLRDAAEEPLVEFVSFVLDDAQAAWARRFAASDLRYRDARLVLFRDAVRSGCGPASSATGPFYCPADETIYLDLGFFDALHRRFGAPGDFAQAYVIAHEIGHHVQHLLGTMSDVRRAQRERPALANDLSVRLELQADCYAGVWAHETERRDLLEQGDLAEGLGAAAAVGDDRLHAQAGGRRTRETWTHGSSAERQRWFRAGYAGGDARACDTFAAR